MNKQNADLKKALAQAKESEKLKSAFLANMSHEIRTPLNAIVGFSSLLFDQDLPEVEKRKFFTIVENNNELLLQLINDILDFSKIESGKMVYDNSLFDLSTLYQELFDSYKMRISDQMDLELDIPSQKCYITFDRSRLIQVIGNLLNNAIKFTEKGTIKFGFSVREKGIYGYVQDSGIGLNKEEQEKVFLRFEKINSYVPGTGLGLSICKSIIEENKGELGVLSEKDKGAKFWFTLPVKIEVIKELK